MGAFHQVIAVIGIQAKADKRYLAEDSVNIEEEAARFNHAIYFWARPNLRLDIVRHVQPQKLRNDWREGFCVVVDRQHCQVNGVDNRDD